MSRILKKGGQRAIIGMALALLTCARGVFASAESKPPMIGNYRPEQVGELWPEQKNHDEALNWERQKGKGETNNLFRLLYFPGLESLYDFDTGTPLTGVAAEGGKIEITTKYYMSRPHSLKWTSRVGSSITCDTDIKLIDPIGPDWKTWYGFKYMTFLGLFQEVVPEGGNLRSFDVVLIDPDGSTVSTKKIWLHKTGWNVLHSEPPLPKELLKKGVRIRKIRLTQTDGPEGELYLDNVMLVVSHPNFPMETKGIGVPVSTLEKVAAFPTHPMMEKEKEAFAKISDRVLPPRPPRDAPSPEELERYRHLAYDRWQIRTVGDFANGLSPLYFYVWTRFPVGNLCPVIGAIGSKYNAATNPAKKRELGKILGDLVRLLVTYDGTPSPWYHGRGFAEGVYHARDAMAEVGLLDRAADRLNQQYKVYDTLYGLLPPGAHDFSWDSDFLNTCSTSYMLALLIRGPTPAAIRDLYQVPIWLDTKALQYHGGMMDGIKADGCWFHHWGNRFDNYGWCGAWSGAVNFIYWLSQTPFRAKQETHERVRHMARVRFNVTSHDGMYGPSDYMMTHPNASPEGYFRLAMAGTPDGSSRIDAEMAGYFMYSTTPEDLRYKEFAAQGIQPAKTPRINATLSYAGINVHRRDEWLLYTHAIAKDVYHDQYVRKGFLFYDIAGLALREPGINSLLAQYVPDTLKEYGYKDDVNALTFGYNLNRAPGVTAPDVSFERACYPNEYQSGSSSFVGGISMQDGNGLFAAEFDGRKMIGSEWWCNAGAAYPKTLAKTFRQKKSFFYFDDDVVCLASGIGIDAPDIVQTGLFQEKMSSPADAVVLPDGRTMDGEKFKEAFSSDKVCWMIDNAKQTGIYLPKGQTFTLFKGAQTHSTTGNIVAAWLEHGKAPKDAGYEYIMSIHPTVEKMKTLAEGMATKTPPYRIVQRDENAHIVRSVRHKATGYVFFNKSAQLPASEAVKAVDYPCIVMARHDDKTGLTLGVADPDRFADPHVIMITLNGLWKLKGIVAVEGLTAPKVDVAADEASKTTAVMLRCSDGLTSECSLEGL